MIEVRLARADDVPFIVAAQHVPHARGHLMPATEAQVRAALERSDRGSFVIARDGALVGALLVGLDPAVPWLVHLRQLIVTEPGCGIGTGAVRWLISWAFGELGAHRVWLEVTAQNRPARTVYERCGFVHEGTFRDGCRVDDGAYVDVCAYGLLATDERADAV